MVRSTLPWHPKHKKVQNFWSVWFLHFWHQNLRRFEFFTLSFWADTKTRGSSIIECSYEKVSARNVDRVSMSHRDLDISGKRHRRPKIWDIRIFSETTFRMSKTLQKGSFAQINGAKHSPLTPETQKSSKFWICVIFAFLAPKFPTWNLVNGLPPASSVPACLRFFSWTFWKVLRSSLLACRIGNFSEVSDSSTLFSWNIMASTE